MKAVAITGAGGMIGRHLVDVLRAPGVTIRALLLPGEAVPPSFEDVEVHRGDICNLSDLSPFLSQVDIVFHLASLVGHDANRVPIDVARRVNVMGTCNVMAEAKRHKVARFVFLSTCSVYGLHGTKDEIVDESAAHAPCELPYDITKSEAEAKVTAESTDDLAWSVLQIPVALGGEHTLDKPTILSLSRILRFGLIPRPISGTIWANYVFGRDVGEALVVLGNHPAAVGQSFIFSESVPLPVFLSWITRELGRTATMVPIPSFAYDLAARVNQFSPALVNRRRFSGNKIETLLGFRPSVGLEKGVVNTIKYYRKIGIVRGRDPA